ncbi:MAG: gamma-glutamylcyclotransferase [Nannocystales bacterium]
MDDELPRDAQDRLWIFGYGSLVWRPSFEHAVARPAVVQGWTRRFWQWSTDHRGVPGSPGRVATVLEAAGESCWGRAYAVDPEHQEGVLAALDHREKQGYDRAVVSLGFPGGAGPRALMYVATPDNPSFAGETPLAELASIISTRHGPSGANLDYLLRLAEALREMGVDDPHVFDLEARCRRA